MHHRVLHQLDSLTGPYLESSDPKSVSSGDKAIGRNQQQNKADPPWNLSSVWGQGLGYSRFPTSDEWAPESEESLQAQAGGSHADDIDDMKPRMNCRIR
ncbi:hypothetical protein Tco_1329282 [Tanacetum coccineum]